MDDREIERLARAVCEAQGFNPDMVAGEFHDLSDDGPGVPIWQTQMPIVRAILAAMWRPIEEAPIDEDVLVSGGTYGCEDVSCEFYSLPFDSTAIASKNHEGDIFSGADLMIYSPTRFALIPEPPK